MSAAANASTKDFVVGLGATGLSIARYLKRHDIDATFFDTRDAPPGISELRELCPAAEIQLGEARLPRGIERVIASPGIADSHPLLARARAKNLEIVSDIELFAREARAPYIAVTGSNGKSTVTTLLYYMCKAAGMKVYAGGNLGEPALDLLDKEPPDIYVLELSSFQLQRTQNLPAEVAVLLNISPDHLDWHANVGEYRRSKYRIYREAKAAVFNRADSSVAKYVQHLDKLVSFGLDVPPAGHYGIRSDDENAFLARGETLLLSTRDLAMIGRHNLANALAALAAGELAGLDISSMLQVLCEFKGLPHRMQFVDRFRSIDFVNDSKATNPAAAVASIVSIDGMIVLIAGGVGKGAEYSELAYVLKDKLRAAILIGEDAEKIANALDGIGPVFFADDMNDAVAQAVAQARFDDTVLLAPACASLDQYSNYAARGEAFEKAVRELRQ